MTVIIKPDTPAQCRLFGAKAGRGESVPDDWKEHCRKGEQKKPRSRPKPQGLINSAKRGM